MVGAVSLLQLDGGGICQSACITMFGVSGTPVRIGRAEEALLGSRVNGSVLQDVSKIVAEELGLPPERVEVTVVDTDATPFDTGVGPAASRE